MTHIPPTYFNHNYRLIFIPLILALAVTICILLSVKHPIYYPSPTHREILNRIRTKGFVNSEQVQNNTAPKRHRDKEVVYNILSNASRTLIAMEIRARRLEDNIKRVRERTRTLLWKNKDKALWKILFKNISRNVAIRHEFHEHSSLRRIMDDKKHRHQDEKHDYEYKSRANDEFFGNEDYENLTM